MNICRLYKIYAVLLYVTLIGIVTYSVLDRKNVFQPYVVPVEHTLPDPELVLLDSLRVEMKELNEAIQENILLQERLNKLEYGK